MCSIFHILKQLLGNFKTFPEFGKWEVSDSFSKNSFGKWLDVLVGRREKEAILQWREEINGQGRSGGNEIDSFEGIWKEKWQ